MNVRLAMTRKITLLMAIASAISLSACARSPETIPAAAVPPAIYAGYSCERLRDLQHRIDTALQSASLQQQSAATNDAWGVFLIGLPVASMGGGDIAPKVASLKGQSETVDQLIYTECARAS